MRFLGSVYDENLLKRDGHLTEFMCDHPQKFCWVEARIASRRHQLLDQVRTTLRINYSGTYIVDLPLL